VKLVDTSSWVHALRRQGDAAVRSRVKSLMEAGEAAWCPMVRLELWNGVRSDNDRKSLLALEKVVPELPVTEEVWQAACDLAERCRRAGKTAPIQDVLIGACARVHGVELEHDDRHYDWLPTL
jgi:predicted nucleic acid-binding protein